MRGRIKMIKEGNIGPQGSLAIATVVLVTKVFYTNPGTVIKGTATASWYVTLLSVLVSLILFQFVYMLLKRFPGKSLSEVFEKVWGKFLGKLLSIVFIAYFIFYAGGNLREFVEMIKTYNLPYTPPSIITITFLLPVAVISYLGLEALARISHTGFYFVIGSLFTILVLDYPLYRIDSIFPLGGNGLNQNLFIGITRNSAYNEMIVLAFFISSLNGLKYFKRASILGLTISGFAISSVILCSIMAFDYTMSTEHFSNLFELSRAIYFGRFFQRLESIFLIVWVTASVISVAAFFYTSISIFCKSFNVNNHKPLIPSFLIITFVVTLLPQDLPAVLSKSTNFQRVHSSLLLYGIPIVTLIISLMFKRKPKSGK
jgi:spore germination protein (amino acid permease)